MKIWPVVALVLAWPGSALADWQWTRWGMTPEELVAASAGNVRLVSADGIESDRGGVKLAEGTFVAGRFQFQADFRFFGGRLAGVALRPPGEQCGDLEYWVLDRYGERDGRTQYAGSFVWRLEDVNTEVSFAQTGSRTGPSCGLRYRAIRHSGNEGL